MVSKSVFLSLDSNCFLLTVSNTVKYGVNLGIMIFSGMIYTLFFFFFPNPVSVGRILNRFSKDIGHLDDLLPLTFLDFVQVIQLTLSKPSILHSEFRFLYALVQISYLSQMWPS